MMHSVAILLATYNGERYLREQVDSIINQSLKNWILYIHDDGSVDNTLSIISEYVQKYDNIKIVDDKIKHRGVAQSFVYLLERVEAEYYMFCDQDDVWLPDKMYQALTALQSMEAEYAKMPILVHTDLKIVDSKLQILKKSFWEYTGVKKYVGYPKYLHVLNYITGCTMLFNHYAKEVTFPIPKNILMHDSWVGLRVSNNKGLIIDLDNPLILYRQHTSNVLGAQPKVSIMTKLFNFISVCRKNYCYYNMVHKATGINFFTYVKLKIQAYLV